MGAFESFVNANLGIRKPLILATGHPSGSIYAAGMIGSEYIDTDSNSIYEKTGENNTEDWVFMRKLGQAPSASSSNVFSKSINVPQNSSSLNISYNSLGDFKQYLANPRVFASIRFGSEPTSTYSHSIYNLNTQRFNIKFSNQITESDCYLDILISANPDEIGDSFEPPVESLLWFDESGNSLVLRNESIITSNPAIHLWETGENDTLIPRETGYASFDESGQYFEQTGDYLTIL